MAKSGTTLKPGDNLPARGMSNKNRILDALRAESFESLTEDSTKDEAEVAFFRHIVKRAKKEDDKDSVTLLKVLADKGWANVKPVYDPVEFEFSKDATISDQANQVLAAAASGEIPPDVAQMFIGSLSNMLKIAEVTDLEERIKALEDDQA